MYYQYRLNASDAAFSSNLLSLLESSLTQSNTYVYFNYVTRFPFYLIN